MNSPLGNNNINSFKEATTELYPKDPDGTGTNLDSNEKNHSKTTKTQLYTLKSLLLTTLRKIEINYKSSKVQIILTIVLSVKRYRSILSLHHK